MDTFSNLAAGFALVANAHIIMIVLIGTVIGIIIGCIPGLSATMGVALAIPVTFSMNTMSGLALLISIYVGGMTGGLISAMLLNIPGTPGNIATTFDGHPLAARGEPGRALGYGIMASFLGGGFSYVCLLFMAPAIANLAVKLSYFSIFSIIMCAMAMIADSTGGPVRKALAAGCIGMLFGVVGPDPIDASYRLTFDIYEISDGFAETSVLIGLFAIPQLLADIRRVDCKCPDFQVSYKNILPGFSELKESAGNLIRSSFIGTAIGLIPGVGAPSAAIVAYNQAKAVSRTPEKFGTGFRDGIFAPEAANNAVSGGAMIPLLTLGIPGCPVAALLLSGLVIKDLQPGPALFSNNPDVVYGFFLAFVMANFAMFACMVLFIKPFAEVLKMPRYLLIPPILAFCTIGAYMSNNLMADVWVLFAFGLVGCFLEKFKYPVAPLVLGYILGPPAELQLRRGLTSTNGDLTPLITDPVSAVFLVIALFVLILPFWQRYRNEKRRKAAGSHASRC